MYKHVKKLQNTSKTKDNKFCLNSANASLTVWNDVSKKEYQIMGNLVTRVLLF